jgi:uncharacterized RDD family membrane protein YckC
MEKQKVNALVRVVYVSVASRIGFFFFFFFFKEKKGINALLVKHCVLKEKKKQMLHRLQPP